MILSHVIKNADLFQCKKEKRSWNGLEQEGLLITMTINNQPAKSGYIGLSIEPKDKEALIDLARSQGLELATFCRIVLVSKLKNKSKSILAV